MKYIFRSFILRLTWIATLVSGSCVIYAKEAIIPTNGPFQYKLQLADIECWLDQTCSGLVNDHGYRNFATELDKILSSATKSLDIAIYGLRNQDWFLERLKKLKRKRVKMRATIDQQRGALGEWDVLRNFAYPDAKKLVKVLGSSRVRPDVNKNGSPRTGSIMHNKFFIIDNKAVWSGSTNISDTGTGVEYNANSSILIKSPALAKLFKAEFEQMYVERCYGSCKAKKNSPQKPRQPKLRFSDGTIVSTYFAPQDSPQDTAIIPFIRSTKKSINVSIFFLTSKPIVQELIQAHSRGVRVRIINDATAARHRSSQLLELLEAGVDIRVENWGGKMHMKTATADGNKALIGSMNWSNAGNNKNDESVLVIENNPTLTSELDDYFSYLWSSLDSIVDDPYYRIPKAESFDSINSCIDGINNDHSGGMDAEAISCQTSSRLF